MVVPETKCERGWETECAGRCMCVAKNTNLYTNLYAHSWNASSIMKQIALKLFTMKNGYYKKMAMGTLL